VGGVSGGQAAMTVVWVMLAVLAAGRLAVFSLARRRRARRPPAGPAGGRRWPRRAHPARPRLEEGPGHGSD
jgi:hypothetical protein